MPKTSNLGDKIIKNIYGLERKKLFFTITKYLIPLTVCVASLIYIGNSLINLLKEQQTLDLLELFNEDQAIIKRYFWDTAQTFYEETPKEHLIVILIMFFLTLFILLLIKINFKKIANKISSILHYYQGKNT